LLLSLFAGYRVVIRARWPDTTASEFLSYCCSLFAGYRVLTRARWPDLTASEFLYDCFLLSFCKPSRANLLPMVRSDSECVSPSMLLFRCRISSANSGTPRYPSTVSKFCDIAFSSAWSTYFGWSFYYSIILTVSLLVVECEFFLFWHKNKKPWPNCTQRFC
jgi:hypothetical protein